MSAHLTFNPPPNWPAPPKGWTPPPGWEPDPTWPAPPEGWQLWLPDPDGHTPTETGTAPPAPTAPLPPPLPPQPAAGDTPSSTPEPAHAGRVEELERELAELHALLSSRVELDDDLVLQEVGIYQYHHPLEHAAAYKERLTELQANIKEFVRAGEAILASDMFTFNNSLAKGRKMTADLSKLMLRAYNSEADNCVRVLRAGNVLTAKKRLEAAVVSIAKLGAMMEMRVNPAYHALRITELELTADFLMRVQEEREHAREERERLREERRAEQELAAERERLEKERSHYENALQALLNAGNTEEAADLQAKLAELHSAIEQNDYRTANIRAGYVYVISNAGAFGPNMVKIGMTRRLEPMDRVRELGDASVPFPFDVHALFFAEDAVTVEAELHTAFAELRVNRVNERREFFFATPQQVRDVLVAKVGNLLEFDEHPEATQYRQSRKYWPAHLADDTTTDA